MRRVLKFLGYFAGSLVLFIGLAAMVVYVSSNNRLRASFAVTPRSIPIPSDPFALAQGKHLAETRGCNDCHGKDYAGNRVIEDAAMGTLHGPNLTRGKGGRVAAFTDEDWIRAIRHGVGPDRHGLFVMPSEEYVHLSDEDLGALIAFLKSVPPVDRERVPTKLGPVSRVLLATGKMKLAAEVIDHANVKPPSIKPAVSVEYGAYIAKSCIGCHGPNLSGGKIAVGPPSWPEAANLTPHADTHIAKWTEADFVNVMRTAKRPDGTDLDPVMPRPFGQMNDVELKALYAYLKSLPPVAKGVR